MVERKRTRNRTGGLKEEALGEGTRGAGERKIVLARKLEGCHQRGESQKEQGPPIVTKRRHRACRGWCRGDSKPALEFQRTRGVWRKKLLMNGSRR